MRAHQEKLSEEIIPTKVAKDFGDEWRHIKRSLAPIIGQRGIAAVFNRALYLASLLYPFLAVALEDNLLASNFESLEAALSQEETDLAAEANQYFYQCFQELVSSLVGESLSLRLLASIPTSAADLGTFTHEGHIRSADLSGGSRHHVGR